MKKLTIVCNIALAAFTTLVLATDGPSREPAEIVLTVLLFLVPAANVLVITHGGTPGPLWGSSGIARSAALANILLLVFSCWAIVHQLPHPAEAGYLEYVALVLLTPVLSLVALFAVRREPVRGLGATPGR